MSTRIIEAIVNKRIREWGTEYYVKWEGQSEDNGIWLQEQQFTNYRTKKPINELLLDFEDYLRLTQEGPHEIKELHEGIKPIEILNHIVVGTDWRYTVKCLGTNEVFTICADVARLICPDLVIKYLENYFAPQESLIII